MNAILWAILAACIWGTVPILEKTGLTSVGPYAGLFYRSLGVLIGIFLLGTVILKPAQIKSVDLKSIVLLVISGFLASFVAQIAFYHGLKAGEVSRVVPIAGSFPLIAFILGVLILGESFTLVKGIGIVLVVGGVWLLRG